MKNGIFILYVNKKLKNIVANNIFLVYLIISMEHPTIKHRHQSILQVRKIFFCLHYDQYLILYGTTVQ